MSIWNTLFAWFGSTAGADMSSSDSGFSPFDDHHHCDINPTTGLPMLGECGGIDIAGNLFGLDLHHDDMWSSTSNGFDSCSDSTSSWDDPFSSSSSWDSGIGTFGDD